MIIADRSSNHPRAVFFLFVFPIFFMPIGLNRSFPLISLSWKAF